MISAIIIAIVLILAMALVPRFIVAREDCIIGFSGTAVSIELQGSGAQASCDRTVQDAQPDAGPSGMGTPYHETSSPQGAEICSGTWSGLTYTVRDNGLLNLGGYQECQWFLNHGGSP